MKKFMSFEELQELEESGIFNTEDNGMSGQYIDHHWYTVTNVETDEQHDVYVKEIESLS